MNWHNLLGDIPAMLVALALIAADVALHLAHDPGGAAPFDGAIPVLVAVYIVGRAAVNINATNGKTPAAPPVSVSSQGPSQVSVGGTTVPEAGTKGPAGTPTPPPGRGE